MGVFCNRLKSYVLQPLTAEMAKRKADIAKALISTHLVVKEYEKKIKERKSDQKSSVKAYVHR